MPTLLEQFTGLHLCTLLPRWSNSSRLLYWPALTRARLNRRPRARATLNSTQNRLLSTSKMPTRSNTGSPPQTHLVALTGDTASLAVPTAWPRSIALAPASATRPASTIRALAGSCHAGRDQDQLPTNSFINSYSGSTCQVVVRAGAT